jgi:hypothetical protein
MVSKEPAKKMVSRKPAKKMVSRKPAKKMVSKEPAKVVSNEPVKKVVPKEPSKKIICVGCKNPARKSCHICGMDIYCSSACAYAHADAHLQQCCGTFRSASTLFEELGSNSITKWLCKL